MKINRIELTEYRNAVMDELDKIEEEIVSIKDFERCY